MDACWGLEMSRQLIESYAAGPEKLTHAIDGLSAEQMQWMPPAEAKAGTWSIQQLMAHLADCECVHADRMKRVIAEESPKLLAFDETRWAKSLAYDTRMVPDSLALIKAVRDQMAVILRHVPEAAWNRTGMHSERGALMLSQLVEGACEHMDHHLEFILAKRQVMNG
ncbi:MAG TPA: DinB family protein [Tepidisphaeraceae bacterium]|nr:DinB family protein [Tepidisphaeraceae bacterium]